MVVCVTGKFPIRLADFTAASLAVVGLSPILLSIPFSAGFLPVIGMVAGFRT